MKDRNNGRNGNQECATSYTSHASPGLIPARGDPATLKSFQKAAVVYDFTFRFAHKFLLRGDRTIDQMIQAARSGKKNLLEGSRMGRTSKELEIKLTNVARASVAELLDDYADLRGTLLNKEDSKKK